MLRIPVGALALLVGGAALAQAPAQPPAAAGQPTLRTDLANTIKQSFDEGDVNNDGFLSRPEISTMSVKATEKVVARMEQEFSALDKDKNGQVSLAEFKAGATARVAQSPEVTLQRFDANKDGKISPAEYSAPVLSVFDRTDANKDGQVTADEAKAAATPR
jgi:hypothetical protein